MFLRLEDNGTNRRVGISQDGENFMYLHSVARTDFITNPDQLCILVDPESVGAAMRVLSWKIE